jgi:hypothetical protein
MTNPGSGQESKRCPKCKQTDRTDFSSCRFCGTRYDAAVPSRGGGFDIGQFMGSKAGIGVVIFLILVIGRPLGNAIQRTLIRHTINDNSQAITDANSALQANPNDFDAHVKRADAYMVIFRADKAIEDYSAALAARPNSAAVLRKRAAAYDAMSDGGDSKRDIEAAKALEH